MNTKRTLLFCADFADYPFMQEAAGQLVDRFDLIVGGRSGLDPRIEPRLPQETYFDWQKYQRLSGFETEVPPTLVVGHGEETEYALAHRRFTRALDRVFLEPLTAMEAERYFYALVAAFETYLLPRAERMVVSFAHNPHFPWHLVFYHVCRRLHVPVIIFKQTQVPDAMLLDSAVACRQSGWLRPSVPISRTLARAEATVVSPRLKESIDINVRSERDAYRSLGPFPILRLMRRYYRRRLAYARNHYFRLHWRTLIRFALRRQRARVADLAYLDQRALRVPPTGDFAYFALHYQPERTTVPEAGFYFDQIRAVRRLAAALPTGWILAVKEHPRQLGDRKPDLRSLHYDRRWLYDAIERIPNAVLVHPFTPSATLVSYARLTASCNGSAIFEGLQHGVPGFTFVHTWHSPCASGPCATDHADLARLVERLAAKSVEEVSADFDRFLESCAQYWFEGANDGVTAEKSMHSDRGALVANVARELAHWAERRSEIPTGRLSAPGVDGEVE